MENLNKKIPYVSSIDYVGPYKITSTGASSSNRTITLSQSDVNLVRLTNETSINEEIKPQFKSEK